jgi:hypothetical protein
MQPVEVNAGSNHAPRQCAGHSISPLLYMMAWLSVAGQLFDLQLPLDAWKDYWQAQKL